MKVSVLVIRDGVVVHGEEVIEFDPNNYNDDYNSVEDIVKDMEFEYGESATIELTILPD